MWLREWGLAGGVPLAWFIGSKALFSPFSISNSQTMQILTEILMTFEVKDNYRAAACIVV
jgi:hypothetical protein